MKFDDLSWSVLNNITTADFFESFLGIHCVLAHTARFPAVVWQVWRLRLLFTCIVFSCRAWEWEQLLWKWEKGFRFRDMNWGFFFCQTKENKTTRLVASVTLFKTIQIGRETRLFLCLDCPSINEAKYTIYMSATLLANVAVCMLAKKVMFFTHFISDWPLYYNHQNRLLHSYTFQQLIFSYTVCVWCASRICIFCQFDWWSAAEATIVSRWMEKRTAITFHESVSAVMSHCWTNTAPSTSNPT